MTAGAPPGGEIGIDVRSSSGMRTQITTAAIVAVVTALSGWLTSRAQPAADAQAREADKHELIGKIEEVRDAQRAMIDRINRDADNAANAHEMQRLRDEGQDQRINDLSRQLPK